MALNQLDTFNIQTIKPQAIYGMNRNAVRASHNNEAKASFQPTNVFNMTKDLERGYRPVGDALDSSLDLEGTVLGQDQFGIVSINNNDLYYLFDSLNAPVAQAASPYSSLDGTTHIPNVGAYKNRNQFMIYDKDGNVVEPFSPSISIAQNQASEPIVVSIGETITQNGLRYFASTDTWWLYGDGGVVFYSDDGMETWNDVSISSGENINDIATDGSNYLAVAANNTIYYTDDDGTTWSTVNPTTSGSDNPTYRSVIWDGNRFIFVGGIAYIWATPDGATLTQVNPIGLDQFTDIIFSNSTYYITEAGEGSEQVFRRATTATYPTLTRIGTGRQGKMNAIATDGSIWVAVGTNEAGTDPVFFVSVDATTWVGYDYNSLDDRDDGWVPADVYYQNGYFLMVGSGSHMYISTNGTSWTRVTSPAGGGDWQCITVGDDGNFYVLNTGSTYYAIVQAASSLTLGQYEILAVPHILTKSGKLVLDLVTSDFDITAQDGSITIEIGADADPDHANFRVDIYVKLAQYTLESGIITDVEKLADQDYVYIDTLEESETLVFSEYPTSPSFVIGSRGAIGICAFGSNTVCSFNGYLWGRLSEDVADYKFLADDINLGDIALPLTVGFTERNYVNLFTVNNYLPLGSRTSDDVTGCAVVSQGLLVFANNETFLVKGDPATTLVSNLYVGRIGLDAGKIAINWGQIAVTIHKGRIYQFVEGQAQELSKDVYRPTDKFTQVVVDTPSDSLIALTENNNVFRLDIDDDNIWTTNTIFTATRLIQALDEVLYLDISDNLYKVNETESIITGDYIPRITFRDLDYYNPNRRDKVISVHIPIKNYGIRYNEENKPRLYYMYREDGLDVETNASALYTEGLYESQMLHFTFPNAKGERWDFSLYLTEATIDVVVEDAWTFRVIYGEEKHY